MKVKVKFIGDEKSGTWVKIEFEDYEDYHKIHRKLDASKMKHICNNYEKTLHIDGTNFVESMLKILHEK